MNRSLACWLPMAFAALRARLCGASWCVTSLTVAALTGVTSAQIAYDTSFATGGKYVSGLNGDDIAKSMALQQGRVYVAGVCPSIARPPLLPAKPACVLRLLANGQADTSFNAGLVSTTGRLSFIIGDTDTDVYDMVVGLDGKITVSGRCTVSSVAKACLLRLLPNGTIDGGFGTGGRVYLPLDTSTGGDALPLLAESDGSVLIASALQTTYAPSTFGYDILIRRVNNAGVATQFGRTTLSPGSSAPILVPRVLLRQADGKIVVALDGQVPSPAVTVTGALRFQADGSHETTYGGPPGSSPFAGYLLAYPAASISGNATVSRAAIMPDGALVITARYGAGFYLAAAVGVNAQPSAGAVSGSDGWLRFRIADLSLGSVTTVDRGVAVASTVDNKILIAAHSSSGGYTAFTRLASDGTLDTSFPALPNSVVDSKVRLAEAGIAIQPDRKIVIVGNNDATNDFAVGRLNRIADPFPACTPDVDGDGSHSATVDGLVWSRVMLGMTGTAVTSGIGFPAGATRTTWSAIRSYLVSECGMVLAP